MIQQGWSQLINTDVKTDVVKLSKKFERQNKAERAFGAIDQIKTDCQIRNASLKLSLLSLCLRIKGLSRREA